MDYSVTVLVNIAQFRGLWVKLASATVVYIISGSFTLQYDLGQYH